MREDGGIDVKYRPIYKCALCGEQCFCDVFNFQTKDDVRYAASQPSFATEVLHNCVDGSIGLAPFIGFKMEVNEEDLDSEGNA